MLCGKSFEAMVDFVFIRKKKEKEKSLVKPKNTLLISND